MAEPLKPPPYSDPLIKGDVVTSVSWLNFFRGLFNNSPRSGTVFPMNPTVGQRFFRTDRNIAYFFDGTYWLSEQILTLSLPRYNNMNPSSAGGENNVMAAFPWDGGSGNGIKILSWTAAYHLATPNDAGNYWTSVVSFLTGANDYFTTIGSQVSTWYSTTRNLNGVYTPQPYVYAYMTSTGSPGIAYFLVNINYRMVG